MENYNFKSKIINIYCSLKTGTSIAEIYVKLYDG